MFTRQGHSPSVVFPRVLGIECVGIVEAAPDTNLHAGQTVAAVMGEMGRAYDGGYAEYTLVPASHIIPLQTTLPWELLAAIPETYLTAWGSLFDAMEVQTGQSLLEPIRITRQREKRGMDSFTDEEQGVFCRCG